MRLSPFERTLYAATAAAVAGAIANKGRSKTGAAAHRAQDFARAQVEEWRIRVKAERMRRLALKRRAGR
jgi:hypothetical protein